MKSFTKNLKVWIVLGLSALMVTGCQGVNGSAIEAAGAGPVAGVAAGGIAASREASGILNEPIIDTPSAHVEHSADNDISLSAVNTGSTLFPMHDMHEQIISAQMAAYLNSFQDIPKKVLQVSHSDYARSGPGNFYETLELLATGEEVTVDGASGSWYRLADGSGYLPMSNLLDSNNPSDLVWSMQVANSGDSETVNECAGGLTEFKAMSKDLGVPVYAMHSYCGGEPILALTAGDKIAIDGQRYEVMSTNDFTLFGSTELMRDLTSEDAFVQACDLTQGITHMVGLKALPNN